MMASMGEKMDENVTISSSHETDMKKHILSITPAAGQVYQTSAHQCSMESAVPEHLSCLSIICSRSIHDEQTIYRHLTAAFPEVGHSLLIYRLHCTGRIDYSS